MLELRFCESFNRNYNTISQSTRRKPTGSLKPMITALQRDRGFETQRKSSESIMTDVRLAMTSYCCVNPKRTAVLADDTIERHHNLTTQSSVQLRRADKSAT